MLMMGQLKSRMPMTIKNIQISLRIRIPSFGEFPPLRDDDRTDVPDHNSTILTQIIVKKHIARTGRHLIKYLKRVYAGTIESGTGRSARLLRSMDIGRAHRPAPGTSCLEGE
jgi:hypothetical protein